MQVVPGTNREKRRSMPTTTSLFRRLADRVAALADNRFAAVHFGATRRYTFAPEPLLWRTPWPAWQLLSWVVVTLLAPTFWLTGILLTINSHSDQPLFWPSLMGIVAITNAVAIVHTNQRHHRRPLTGYVQCALHYFRVCMITGCALFLLLAWSSGVLHDFTAPLASTMGTSDLVLWTVAIAGFGVVSFAPASLLHGWMAFEA
jgi:hypothetical protein